MVYNDNDIDWSRPPEFLDTELQNILRGAAVGVNIVDKLVKVWLKDGMELWLLLHIEVQSQYERGLPKRVCRYNIRIWDVYDHPVVSLVLLADDHPGWKPDSFGFGRWGAGTTTRFLVSKLLEWGDRWEELEQSNNPFAVATMAHLKTMQTRHNPEERAEWRFRFVRRLYEGGFSREHVEDMLGFLDWVMALPEDLERQFDDRVERFETERRMDFIPHWERRGIRTGRLEGSLQTSREAVLAVLETRFTAVDPSIADAISRIDDLEWLKRMHRRAILAARPEDVLEEALAPTA